MTRPAHPPNRCRSSRKQKASSRGKRSRRLHRGIETLESRQLLAVVNGTVFVDLNGDRTQDFDEVGVSDVRVYLDANDNSQLDVNETSVLTNASGAYSFDSVPVGQPIVRIEPPAGKIQNGPTTYYGIGEVGADATFGNTSDFFEIDSSGQIRLIGTTDNIRIFGATRNNDGVFYGIGSNNANTFNTIYTMDGSTGSETLLATHNGFFIAPGIAYDEQTDTMFVIASTTSSPNDFALYVVDQQTGDLVGPRSETLPLPIASDIVFDSVNRRIVGYENRIKRFFEFRLDGTANLLALATPPINSFAIGFDGETFLMIGQAIDDAPTVNTFQVDPDRGILTPSFVPSDPIEADALIFAGRGDIAHRLSITTDNESITADFSVVNLPPPIDPTDYPIVINELLVDAYLSRDNTDQFIELRGAPGGQLPDNTFLVIVDEDNQSTGEIHGIFDLGNQAFGSNGFLVLLEQYSPYIVDPFSRVLQSTATGFGGLPGNLYSDSHTITDRIDFILGGNSYMLIRSDVAPQLGDDIDLDDDGFADPNGVMASWEVLDSISLHPASSLIDQAYSDILIAEASFSEDPTTRTVPSGATIVVSEGFGYTARIGDSIGSGAEDWLSGRPGPRTGRGADTNRFEIQGNFSRLPEPTAFHSRDLDHVGGSNFVGGVRGTITVAPPLSDDPANGGNGSGTVTPVSGVTVLADTNGNGIQDVLTHVVDPDFAIDFLSNVPSDDQSLTNVFPGVTLSATLSNQDNDPVTNDIRSAIEFGSSIRNRIFSRGALDNFYSTQKLRFDFYRPVFNVSITAIGPNIGSLSSYGRLEAYDENDNLIDGLTSGGLIGASRQTIEVSSNVENIAYVVAYADTSVPGSTNIARFDRLQYQQSELIDVTDANGQYQLNPLFPGDYQVRVLQDSSTDTLLEQIPENVKVRRYENFIIDNQLRPNSPPTIVPEVTVSVVENTSIGTEVVTVSAIDLDGQRLRYSLVGANGFFVIDPNTGVISTGPGPELDFETTPSFQLTVTVSDSFSETQSIVTVNVQDLNEPPEVIPGELFVTERSENGTIVGRVRATDPDQGSSGSIGFQIIGGDGAPFFSVDSQTGILTVSDNSSLDFTTSSQYVLQLRVTDGSTPPLAVDFQQVIHIVDVNDPPEISTTQIEVPEGAIGIVGQIEVTDLDVSQFHDFRISGGSGENLFNLSPHGELTVKPGAILDFEAQNTYTILVVATDNGLPSQSDQASIPITITDRNEPPTFAQTQLSVPENSDAGTLVSILQTLDPEGSDTVYNVLLLPTIESAEFSFDSASGRLTVSPQAELDFESDRNKTLRFRISSPDANEPTGDVTVQVQLTDQNDPPRIRTSQLIVSELAAPGSQVGNVPLQVSDPDLEDQLTAQIIGGNAKDFFHLDEESLVITVVDNTAFDVEANNDPLELIIAVTDQAGLTTERVVSIGVNDVNEPPEFSIGRSELDAPNLESGQFYEFVIPSDSIVDPEGGRFQVAVFGADGQLPDWLEFDQQSMTLQGLATPETVGAYPLTLRAFEFGPPGLGTDLSFSINVIPGSTPLSYKRNRYDVNGNGFVTALDALRVVNHINRNSDDLIDDSQPFGGFVDVNGDGKVTALDALLVINEINAGGGEGEAAWQPLSVPEINNREAIDRAFEELGGESQLF